MTSDRESTAASRLTGWSAWAGDLWQPRNPLLLELGPGGELLASRVRVVALWAQLLALHAFPPAPGSLGLRLAVSAAALAAALALHAVVSWAYRASLPYLTVACDVALAVTLARLVRAEAPGDAYGMASPLLVALALAAVRHEPKLVLEAGVAGALALGWLGGARLGPLALLALATGLLAAGLSRARRQHGLHDTDPLTGLLRGETFEQWLRDELQRSRRHGHNLVLALVEIDHLHDLAARHGAPRSLAVQRSVAAILKRSLRGTDVVARHGSGLFALALPETDAHAALPRLEALRRSIASASRGGADEGATVSVSAGVAGWPAEADETSGLMAVAEQRLRDAHDAGGDRLVGPD